MKMSNHQKNLPKKMTKSRNKDYMRNNKMKMKIKRRKMFMRRIIRRRTRKRSIEIRMTKYHMLIS